MKNHVMWCKCAMMLLIFIYSYIVEVIHTILSHKCKYISAHLLLLRILIQISATRYWPIWLNILIVRRIIALE